MPPGKKQKVATDSSCLIFPSSKDEDTDESIPSRTTEDLEPPLNSDTAGDRNTDLALTDQLLLAQVEAILDIRDAFIETRDMLRCDIMEEENAPLPLSAYSKGLTSSRPSSRLEVIPITTTKSIPQPRPCSPIQLTPLSVSSRVQALFRRTTGDSPSSTVNRSPTPMPSI